MNEKMEKWLNEHPDATLRDAFEAGLYGCTDAWCRGKREKNGGVYKINKRNNRMKHEQVIYGSVPSKSNQYRIVKIGGHGSLAKTSAMTDFEKKFYLQCGAYRNKNIQGFFELYADVYFQSNQPDLDNSLKGLLDCLQSCKAIKNDRNCVKIVANKFIDKNNPRIEFTIVEVKGIEIKDSKEPGLFD